MLRSSIRSGITALASLASAAPIEIITATFIVVTLTYFQLLHAIKGSEFFNTPATVLAPPRPLSLLRLAHPIQDQDESPFAYPSSPPPLLNSFSNSNTWLPIPTADFRRVLEADALEGGYVFPQESGGNVQGEKATIVFVKQLNVVREDVEGSTDEWEKWLLNDVAVEHEGKRYTYRDLCFECDTKLEQHQLHDSQYTLTLYLVPPSPNHPTLAYLNHLAHLPSFSAPGFNTTFRILPASTSWGLLPSFDGAGLFANVGETASSSNSSAASDKRSVRWFAFAARAFVMRFVALAKVRRPFVLLLVDPPY